MTMITEQGASPHMKSPSKFVTDLVNSAFLLIPQYPCC